MSDHWLFKSETYDNCNCAINCGCQFNLPSTYGYCQSATPRLLKATVPVLRAYIERIRSYL